MRTLPVVVACVAALAFVPVHPASAEPTGFSCAGTTFTRPGQVFQQPYAGEVDGGPIVLSDVVENARRATLTCTVQAWEDWHHADPDWFAVTSPSMVGVVVLPPTVVTFPDRWWSICTSLDVEGVGTLYLAVSPDPTVDPYWSTDPNVPCATPVITDDPGDPLGDLVDSLICPVLEGPLAAYQGVWGYVTDCRPSV
jgi:hypothetical protein